jgi:hypothetical protein
MSKPFLFAREGFFYVFIGFDETGFLVRYNCLVGGAEEKLSATGLGCMGTTGRYGPADEADTLATLK